MSKDSTNKPYLHEACYLLLWNGAGIALLFAGRFSVTDAWFLIPMIVCACLLTRYANKGKWLQARLWFPLISLNATYTWLGNAIPRLRAWRADDALCAVDRFLFGECLGLKMEPFLSYGAKEILSAFYFSFFLIWLGSLPLAARRRLEFQKAYFKGFHLLYALGYIGYILVPACGPFRYAPIAEKIASLGSPVGPVWKLNDAVIRSGCNGVDVFPSLHTAVTIFLLLSSYRVSKRLFLVMLIPCLLIIISTIGLHYHYMADLLAGAILSMAVWWNTVRKHTTQSA